VPQDAPIVSPRVPSQAGVHDENESQVMCRRVVVEKRSVVHTLQRGLFLQHRPWRSRHQCALGRRVILLELITHLLHGYKFDSVMFLEMLDEPVGTSLSANHAVLNITSVNERNMGR
jgi:hypothetical protein